MATVLIVGGGAREHALAYKLSQSPHVTALFATPGNPGIAEFATCSPISDSDIPALVQFAKEKSVDLVVVGPEKPLVLGLADALKVHNIACFGPNKISAQLEGSKTFAKDLMAKYHIPTAAYRTFYDAEAAKMFIRQHHSGHVVLKADGLAQGKGVVIATNQHDAIAAIDLMMQDKAFGDAGCQIVIEDFLVGEEVSILTFCDGKTIVPMLPVQDHKCIGENDTGLNTGGMGTYAPASIYSSDVAKLVQTRIITPLQRALQAEGLDYQGCLYIGLMLTENGPYVIEFNARFGDPETEVLMPLLKSDLYDIMQACVRQSLTEQQITWHSNSAVCVILASGGYPETYKTGFVITENAPPPTNTWLFHAGTKQNTRGELVTAGGRVLAVTATDTTFLAAQQRVYKRVKNIHFEQCYFRRDIGFKENKRLRKSTI